jgi:hypothetical protein
VESGQFKRGVGSLRLRIDDSWYRIGDIGFGELRATAL